MPSVDPGPVSRWSFTLEFRSSVRLPAHHGSMLRGALGHQLKALHCQCPEANNKIHLSGCLYAAIFEQTNIMDLPGVSEAPPAFVFAPLKPQVLADKDTPEVQPAHVSQAAITGQHAFSSSSQPEPLKRSTLLFRGAVTLMGEAHQQPEVFFLALRMAAAHGLGTPPSLARLENVRPEAWIVPEQCDDGLRLTFQSPFYIKQRQKGYPSSFRLQADAIRLRDVVVALHRRLSLLEQVYGLPGPSPNDLASWLLWAENAKAEYDLHDEQFARRSNRQQQKMSLSGLLGNIQIKTAPPPDLWRALHLGEWLHIGGKTGLGLGGYRLAPLKTDMSLVGNGDATNCL